MPFSPTEEQQRTLEAFKSGDTLKIDAYAGTGKTTTLTYLARSRSTQGHYLAFNKALAEQAQGKFPQTVRCTTNHALAFRAIQRKYAYSQRKLTENANANLISQALHLPPKIYFDCHPQLVLSNRSYGALLRNACRRFLYSQSPSPVPEHIPRHGKLAELKSPEFDCFAQEVLPKLRQLWSNMQDPSGVIPLGHDGYLKLWSLSSPRIEADYIMVDEAQDSNPVILQVLADQQSQVVYVGDPYQQIYEWRGAVNAMNQVHANKRTSLTESFRFGPSIAAAASKVIALLGATTPIRGNSKIRSDICSVYPEAVLCRTNAGVIWRLIGGLLARQRCHVLGGTRELQGLLQDVQRLKRGVTGELPDFFGFSNWADVEAFTDLPEGEDLKGIVKLVGEHGEDRLLAAVSDCQECAEGASVTLSTTHKAKGQQWNTVAVHSDFEVMFRKLAKNENEADRKSFEAAARVLYVAMTRAQMALEPPPMVMTYFGLQRTRKGRVRSRPQRPHGSARVLGLIRSIFAR